MKSFLLLALFITSVSSYSNAHDQSFIPDTLSSLGLGNDSNGKSLKSQMHVQTLRFSLFPERNEWRDVRGRAFVEIPYVLTSPEKPLVFIQSGLANSGTSPYNYFLMWHLKNAGYNVVTVPNQYFWRMTLASSTYLRPGETEQDLKDLFRTYRALRDQLIAKGQLKNSVQNYVVGVSYGGYNAIQMSGRAQQALRMYGIEIHKFVAINPPLDLKYGLDYIDRGFLEGRKALSRERQLEVMGGLQAVVYDQNLTFIQKMSTINSYYNSIEQNYALSYVFLEGVQELIAVSQLLNDQGIFSQSSLTDRLRLARTWTSRKYLDQVLIPFYLQKGVSERDFFSKTRILKEISQAKPSGKLFLVHAMNDALVSQQDIQTASRLLGSRNSFVSERGGHLGNLHDPRAINSILDFLSR